MNRRLTRKRILHPATAAAGVLVCLVGLSHVASSAAEPHGLTEKEAVGLCRLYVGEKLAHPDSADFGVYTVKRAGQGRTSDDYLIEGRALATGARTGQTLPFGYTCNVQPFNGATVATIRDGLGD